MRNILTILKDSELVWQFQQFFGVRKVEQIEHVEGGPWVVREAGQGRGRDRPGSCHGKKTNTDKPPDWLKNTDEGTKSEKTSKQPEEFIQ